MIKRPDMSNVTAIQFPDIGDFDTVEVIEILIKVGDTVKAEQSLITVESDKASMEIPTSIGGVVKSIEVKVGDKVDLYDDNSLPVDMRMKLGMLKLVQDEEYLTDIGCKVTSEVFVLLVDELTNVSGGE
jgi:glycine cleavage system H lipoate-binding protein